MMTTTVRQLNTKGALIEVTTSWAKHKGAGKPRRVLDQTFKKLVPARLVHQLRLPLAHALGLGLEV